MPRDLSQHQGQRIALWAVMLIGIQCVVAFSRVNPAQWGWHYGSILLCVMMAVATILNRTGMIWVMLYAYASFTGIAAFSAFMVHRYHDAASWAAFSIFATLMSAESLRVWGRRREVVAR